MSQGLDWIFSFELKSGKTKKKKVKERKQSYTSLL